jgi:hypothetical protein
MNENSQPAFGKISVHGNGMGAPTPELVEKRAREIALIDERDPENFTDADWDQARRELLGVEIIPPPPEDTDERFDEVSDRDSVPGENGHRVPRPGVSEEDETLGAHLVTDGNEEAAHDQRVVSAQEDQEQEG